MEVGGPLGSLVRGDNRALYAERWVVAPNTATFRSDVSSDGAPLDPQPGVGDTISRMIYPPP